MRLIKTTLKLIPILLCLVEARPKFAKTYSAVFSIFLELFNPFEVH